MSNKTRLQTNNTNLQVLIDKANALPEAGSGGGGNVETYAIKVISGYIDTDVHYTAENGAYNVIQCLANSTITIMVKKDTVVALTTPLVTWTGLTRVNPYAIVATDNGTLYIE